MNGAKRILEIKFLFIIFLYLIAGASLIQFYKYQISPDSISYISIAQKYLHGDFKHAINGIWSPFYSWCLIPFIYFGVEPLLASLILTVLFGLFVLIAVKELLGFFELPAEIGYLILVSLVPVILSFAFSDSPSDLFNVFFLLVYLKIIFDKNYATKKFNGFLCGLIGSLAYFCKAYSLPFFISHFAVINLIHLFHKNKKYVLANFAIGLLTFSIISGIWIALISNKYEQLTFSTAAKFNYLAAGPESKSKGGPFYYQGLFAPSNATAVSAWEDPTYHVMPDWSPFDSWKLFKYQINLIQQNSIRTMNIFNSFSSLAQFIVFLYFLLAIMPINKLISETKILLPLVSLFLYSAGYILIVVESRYLWINCILLFLMGGFLIKRLFSLCRLTIIQKYAFVIFFAATFMVPSLRYLKSNINTKKEVFLLSKKLEKEFKITGHIAANEHNITMYIAYHIGAQYYGKVQDRISMDELENEFVQYNIDYFFVWGEKDKFSIQFNDYKEVTGGDIPGLKIYSLKNSN